LKEVKSKMIHDKEEYNPLNHKVYPKNPFYKFEVGEEIRIKGTEEIGIITRRSFPFNKESGSIFPARYYNVDLKDQHEFQDGFHHTKGRDVFNQKNLEKKFKVEKKSKYARGFNLNLKYDEEDKYDRDGSYKK
jgi:hypothetical protein